MMLYEIVASPFIVIVFAEILLQLYETAYILLALGSNALKDPGQFVLRSSQLRSELYIFREKYKHEVRKLVGKQRILFYLQQEDIPLELSIIFQDVLNDTFYDALLWIAFPLQWLICRIKMMFEK